MLDELLDAGPNSADIWRVHFMLALIACHGFTYDKAHAAYIDEETMMKYRVHGYCLLPAEAEIEVEAGSPDDALRVALAAWAINKQALIVGNTEDASAAFDWQPSVEAVPNYRAMAASAAGAKSDERSEEP